MDYIIVIFLVLLSGLFSGLTLGLLSLDKSELERKIQLGNKKAKKVYSVRKRGNLLLCTLLLGNVAVNSAVAIFLGNIASGVVAGFVATGLIVIFGEIVPQASCSKYGLEIGARTAWLVKIFIVILFPICWPIAWVLDKVLGEEMPTIYSKKELMKIVEDHEAIKESAVDEDEKRIVAGALSYSDKVAREIMTPRTVIFCLNAKEILNKELLKKIQDKGFTRIPVFEESIDDVVGLLYIKDLIGVRMGTKIDKICRKNDILFITPETKLDELLNHFIKSHTHLACVREDEYGSLEGIVSLEDVIEEIFNVEIVDESDRVIDMQKLAKDKMHKKR